MGEKPTGEDFGSPEGLLRAIQERSDDIEKAVIIPPGYVLRGPTGRQMSAPTDQFTMLFHFVNGDRKMIHGDDGEMVLNDGILNRMKIKIEFAKGQAG